MNFPKSIYQGDEINISIAPYIDSQGRDISATNWELILSIRGNGVSHTENGENFFVGITGEVTKGFAPGTTYYQLSAKHKTQALRITISQGELLVLPDLAYAPSNYDPRTQDEKDLEQVSKLISEMIGQNKGVVEYRIGIRSLKRYELSDLRLLKADLEYRVHRSKHKSSGVYVRFT